MIQGSCHCGALRWEFDGQPAGATACNCTVCRRYGVLWAYDYEGEGIRVAGKSNAYLRGKVIAFHFCPACGCVAFWRAQEVGEDGRRRIAVNLRLAEPDAVARQVHEGVEPVEAIDGDARDGRCVADYWF